MFELDDAAKFRSTFVTLVSDSKQYAGTTACNASEWMQSVHCVCYVCCCTAQNSRFVGFGLGFLQQTLPLLLLLREYHSGTLLLISRAALSKLLTSSSELLRLHERRNTRSFPNSKTKPCASGFAHPSQLATA